MTGGLHTKLKNKIIKYYEKYRWLFTGYWPNKEFPNIEVVEYIRK